jgi:hypothetical protein
MPEIIEPVIEEPKAPLRYIYAAAAIVEEAERPGVQPRPVVDDEPLTAGFRWLALAPWFFFETREPLAGAVPAPATYPNGTPVDTDCDQPWCESESQ